jgi:nucleotide-binding universal stress UspA family protein
MTLLVAIDSSHSASPVVAHAAAFARATGLTMNVTRVLDPMLDYVGGPDTSEEVAASVRATWEEEMRKLLEENGAQGHTRVTLMRQGERVHQAIVRAAHEADAKAIAIGSHGASVLRHAVLGSVAMGVVGGTDLPVFIAGPRAASAVESDGYRILVAEESDDAGQAPLARFGPLMENGTLRLTLLNVYEQRLGDRGERTETAEALERMERQRDTYPFADRIDVIVRPLHDFERLDGAILRVAEEIECDAVAMTTRGHSTRRHILAGSVAVGVLKHARMPVVMLRRS